MHGRRDVLIIYNNRMECYRQRTPDFYVNFSLKITIFDFYSADYSFMFTFTAVLECLINVNTYLVDDNVVCCMHSMYKMIVLKLEIFRKLYLNEIQLFALRASSGQ